MTKEELNQASKDYIRGRISMAEFKAIRARYENNSTALTNGSSRPHSRPARSRRNVSVATGLVLREPQVAESSYTSQEIKNMVEGSKQIKSTQLPQIVAQAEKALSEGNMIGASNGLADVKRRRMLVTDHSQLFRKNDMGDSEYVPSPWELDFYLRMESMTQSRFNPMRRRR